MDESLKALTSAVRNVHLDTNYLGCVCMWVRIFLHLRPQGHKPPCVHLHIYLAKPSPDMTLIPKTHNLNRVAVFLFFLSVPFLSNIFNIVFKIVLFWQLLKLYLVFQLEVYFVIHVTLNHFVSCDTHLSLLCKNKKATLISN